MPILRFTSLLIQNLMTISYPNPKEQFRSKIESWGFEHDPEIEGQPYKGREVTWAAQVPDDWGGDPSITHAVLIEGDRSYCEIGYRYADGHITV